MSRDLINVWISECMGGKCCADTLNARCFSTDICKRTWLGLSYSYGKHIPMKFSTTLYALGIEGMLAC